MNYPKASSNDAGMTKLCFNLLRCGIGGYVKIFWFFSEQEIPDRTTNYVGLVSRIIERVENAQAALADVFSGNTMLVPAEDGMFAVFQC